MNIKLDTADQIESETNIEKDTNPHGSSIKSEAMKRSSKANSGNFSFGDTPTNIQKIIGSKTSESDKPMNSEQLLKRVSILEDKQQQNESKQQIEEK